MFYPILQEGLIYEAENAQRCEKEILEDRFRQDKVQEGGTAPSDDRKRGQPGAQDAQVRHTQRLGHQDDNKIAGQQVKQAWII